VRDLFRREEWVNASKAKQRESTEWLRRFWEPHLRDQADFNRPMDYLHWNPLKHGHVAQVADWPYSTFHRYVRAGVYPRNGGAGEAPPFNTEDFGESPVS
jgi:Transposase and inactivated derivatives